MTVVVLPFGPLFGHRGIRCSSEVPELVDLRKDSGLPYITLPYLLAQGLSPKKFGLPTTTTGAVHIDQIIVEGKFSWKSLAVLRELYLAGQWEYSDFKVYRIWIRRELPATGLVTVKGIGKSASWTLSDWGQRLMTIVNTSGSTYVTTAKIVDSALTKPLGYHPNDLAAHHRHLHRQQLAAEVAAARKSVKKYEEISD